MKISCSVEAPTRDVILSSVCFLCFISIGIAECGGDELYLSECFISFLWEAMCFPGSVFKVQIFRN